MSDVIMTNQIFHHIFLMGNHKSALSIAALSQTCNGAKLFVSIVDTYNSLEEQFLFLIFSCFSGSSSTCTYYIVLYNYYLSMYIFVKDVVVIGCNGLWPADY